MKSNENIIESNSSKTDVLAIIPSGGIGKRMMSKEPKQFMTINGEPILLITIRALISTGLIKQKEKLTQVETRYNLIRNQLKVF